MSGQVLPTLEGSDHRLKCRLLAAGKLGRG